MIIEYIFARWLGPLGMDGIYGIWRGYKIIGSGFKATDSTSMFAVCGIFGLLLIQALGIQAPFKLLVAL